MQTDAHVLDLLASYEELLKVTARALVMAKALADAVSAGVLPPDLERQRSEIATAQLAVLRLEARVAEFKALFRVH
jgi:hypothetical protein